MDWWLKLSSKETNLVNWNDLWKQNLLELPNLLIPGRSTSAPLRKPLRNVRGVELEVKRGLWRHGPDLFVSGNKCVSQKHHIRNEAQEHHITGKESPWQCEGSVTRYPERARQHRAARTDGCKYEDGWCSVVLHVPPRPWGCFLVAGSVQELGYSALAVACRTVREARARRKKSSQCTWPRQIHTRDRKFLHTCPRPSQADAAWQKISWQGFCPPTMNSGSPPAHWADTDRAECAMEGGGESRKRATKIDSGNVNTTPRFTSLLLLSRSHAFLLTLPLPFRFTSDRYPTDT